VGLLVTVTSLVAAAASLPFGVLADRVRRTRLLGGAIVLWGAAMIWSATAPTFGQLLLARLFLGGVTAAAGPIVASLVGDWFASSERGRIYGYIISGELVGAAFGFAVTGGIATLSWRASFVILALPAFALAWLVFALPEPTRGGRNPLISATARPVAAAADADGEQQATDAQRLANELGIEPDPELVLRPDPRRLGLLAAARYVLSIRTNVALILASAGGYYFLSGVQTFGVEFVTKQYGIAQALSTLVLLAVGAAGVIGVLVGRWLGDFLLHRGFLNGRILVSAIAAICGCHPLCARDLHPQPADGAALHLARRARPLRAKPTDRRRAPRHRSPAPLGARRRHPHSPPHARAGDCTVVVRGGLGLRVRRRAVGAAVDLPVHAPPPCC